MAQAVKFSGARVLITGGSSGIGLATARQLARRGADIVLLARNVERLEAACEAVSNERADASQVVWTRSVDITDAAAVAMAVAELADEGFTPDILVNCAGGIEAVEFERIGLETFRHVMETDFFGLVHVTDAVLPLMTARGSGAIVNVSSVAGFIGVYGYTAYSSAKFATMGFSECLRQEVKPLGLSVHVVCPPDTDTPFLTYEKSHRPAETDKIAGTMKPISPDSVATALVRGLERGRYLIIPGFESTLYFYLKGIAPWLFRLIFDSNVASVRKARGQ